MNYEIGRVCTNGLEKMELEEPIMKANTSGSANRHASLRVVTCLRYILGKRHYA